MKQKDLGLEFSTRRTRKQIMLEEMEQVMPWAALLALISPHAPVAKTGRPPFDLGMMLRIHCLQQWFGLSCCCRREIDPNADAVLTHLKIF